MRTRPDRFRTAYRRPRPAPAHRLASGLLGLALCLAFASAALAGPIAQLSPGFLDFGNQVVGTQSAFKQVIVHNTGDANLAIHVQAITGPNAADFILAQSSDLNLAPGQSAILCTVYFKPTAVGSRTASVPVISNTPESPHSVALFGTGIATANPALTISPASLAFGPQLWGGNPSGAKLVVVKNTGNVTVVFSSVAISGANASDFTAVGLGNLPVQLVPGSLSPFGVIFDPKGLGTRTATLTITSDPPVSPQSVSLSGVGFFNFSQWLKKLLVGLSQSLTPPGERQRAELEIVTVHQQRATGRLLFQGQTYEFHATAGPMGELTMMGLDPAQGPAAQLVAHGQVVIEGDIAGIELRYRLRGGEEGLLSLRQVASEVGMDR